MLMTARTGLGDLNGPVAQRRLGGLCNVVVFGVATTQALQKLRSLVGKEQFDEWYLPFRQEMRDDPLMRYFWNLRTQILHEGMIGELEVQSKIDDMDKLGKHLRRHRPPNATRMFMVYSFGGCGWIVSLPDGTDGYFYVDVPRDTGLTISLHLPNPPKEHVGVALQNTSLENLGELYVAELVRIVLDAQRRFN